MLYPDHEPMLWQWRMMEQPSRVIAQAAPCSTPLVQCPSAPEQLARELKHLPPSPLQWHFAVPSKKLRIGRGRVGYSVFTQELPEDSFLQINSHMCPASPHFLFLQLASSTLSLHELILLGDELCGTYTMVMEPNGYDINRSEPLTTAASLHAFLQSAPHMNNSRKALRALQYVVDGSASIRESMLEMIMCLPPRLGGYGLPQPKMNWRVDFSEHARIIAKQDFARCDLCWPEFKLDVEYNGAFWHTAEEDAVRDTRRKEALQSMGWEVITVSCDEFEFQSGLYSIICTIAKRLRHRLRTYSDETWQRRLGLYRTLAHIDSQPLFCSMEANSLQRIWWRNTLQDMQA